MTRTRTFALGIRDASIPLECASYVLAATGAFLLLGLGLLAAYLLTGNAGWVENFFRAPGALFFLVLASLQLAFALMVWKEFRPGEPMRLAWALISWSAGFEVAGTLATKLLAPDSSLSFLKHTSAWSDRIAHNLQFYGWLASGTIRFALLAGGLLAALKVYHRAGFLGRLRVPDRLILAAIAIYIFWEAAAVVVAVQKGKQLGWEEIAGWPVDPLLFILTLEAMLLYRSVRQMGISWIGRCWMAFSAGILLVVIGDASFLAGAYGYLPWPWSALEWYVWLPSSAAFAIAPAYQLEAVWSAGQR